MDGVNGGRGTGDEPFRRLVEAAPDGIVVSRNAIPWDRRDATIAVSARAADGRVFVEVTDDGEGIAPELLPRIFDPYFTTKQASGGTGLGLSICRDIVTRLGGSLEAESTPGRGTTMRVTLPTAEAQRPVTARPPRATSGVRRRVLVIDDEPMIVSSVVGILSGTHDVAGETDPHRGLARIAAGEDFDVVLCDLMMPGLSGMDLYARVADARPGFERRFVFVTAGAYTEPTRAFLAQVPNAQVSKPFSTAELSVAIAGGARG